MPNDINSEHRPQRASEVLLAALRNLGDEVTIEEITRALGDRAYGVVMLLFCLPNCIPAPPGMNSVFGIPLLLYALQLLRHRSASPWQPRFIAQRRFRKETLVKLLDAARPRLQSIERLCRPRLTTMVTGTAERWIAFYVVLLSICIIIPLWGTNFIPAVGAALIAVSLLEQDGALAIVGVVIGLIGIAITVAVTRGLVWVMVEALARLF
jgi:hypothetical protein